MIAVETLKPGLMLKTITYTLTPVGGTKMTLHHVYVSHIATDGNIVVNRPNTNEYTEIPTSQIINYEVIHE